MNSSPIDQLTGQIIECAMQVHRRLGPGLLESTYEACLEYELKRAGLHVERQKAIAIQYDDIVLDEAYRIDLFVEHVVVVEVKAARELHPVHEAQAISYVKLAKVPAGLLINFHVPLLKNGIRRIVNDRNARTAGPT